MRFQCKNCDTEHGTPEEAIECCQCESCVVLKAQLKASEDYATTLTGTHPDDVHKSRDERIAELEKGLRLLLSWADNWDSPFLEDDEWIETDGPKIRALAAQEAGK
jgi:hypothetical protein